MADFHDLIGVPFASGGRGPDQFDCYGLVMECARRDGVMLPDFGFGSDQALAAAIVGASLPQWREVAPEAGAVALFRLGRHVSHVAYLVTPHQMIHAWNKAGGVCMARLEEWIQRTVGFYKHVGN